MTKKKVHVSTDFFVSYKIYTNTVVNAIYTDVYYIWKYKSSR